MDRLMNGNNINHFFILKLYTFPITRYDNTLFSSRYLFSALSLFKSLPIESIHWSRRIHFEDNWTRNRGERDPREEKNSVCAASVRGNDNRSLDDVTGRGYRLRQPALWHRSVCVTRWTPVYHLTLIIIACPTLFNCREQQPPIKIIPDSTRTRCTSKWTIGRICARFFSHPPLLSRTDVILPKYSTFKRWLTSFREKMILPPSWKQFPRSLNDSVELDVDTRPQFRWISYFFAGLNIINGLLDSNLFHFCFTPPR